MNEWEQKVYEYIKAHPGCQPEDVARALRIRVDTVNQIVTALMANRKVVRPDPPKPKACPTCGSVLRQPIVNSPCKDVTAPDRFHYEHEG